MRTFCILMLTASHAVAAGMVAAILLPLLGTAALGQELNVGVMAGTNWTDDVRSGRETSSGGRIMPSGQTQTYTFIADPGERRPIVGLTLEYRLSHNWSVEFDILRRPLKSTSTILVSPPYELPDGRTSSTLGTSTRTLTPWEFPLLAKYRLPGWTLRPFLTAGPSFRPAGNGTGLSHAGATVGGGVEFRTGGFRVSPAVRYTRWSSANSFGIGSPLQNQIEILVGLDRPSPSPGVHAFGKRLSMGVIAGIGLGQDFQVGRLDISQIPEANSGAFGVMIEARLSKNWAVELDGLYRPLHGSELEFGRRVRFAHLTWEFPVLLKYRFSGKRGLRPFVEGGPSFRAEGNLNLQSVSRFGATVGAGLETKLSWLKVSPMLRYTRWGGSGGGGALPRTWSNQTQVLVSFAF
ncbi:MAG: outer membrane beta-barrel protein [Bryobacteraceae bacterium]